MGRRIISRHRQSLKGRARRGYDVGVFTLGKCNHWPHLRRRAARPGQGGP